jgi:histidyl-tRNA synthetase
VPGLKLASGVPSAGFKAQLRRADKSGARYAAIIGDTELAADRVSVKPLREDAPQELLTVEQFAARLAARNRIAP